MYSNIRLYNIVAKNALIKHAIIYISVNAFSNTAQLVSSVERSTALRTDEYQLPLHVATLLHNTNKTIYVLVYIYNTEHIRTYL